MNKNVIRGLKGLSAALVASGFITFTSLNPTSCFSAWRATSSLNRTSDSFIHSSHQCPFTACLPYIKVPVLGEFTAYLILSSLYLGWLGLLRSLLGIQMKSLAGFTKPRPTECLLPLSTGAALTPWCSRSVTLTP